MLVLLRSRLFSFSIFLFAHITFDLTGGNVVQRNFRPVAVPCLAGFIHTSTAIAPRQKDQSSIRSVSRVPVTGVNANASFRACVART